jgi:hypothetical protein
MASHGPVRVLRRLACTFEKLNCSDPLTVRNAKVLPQLAINACSNAWHLVSLDPWRPKRLFLQLSTTGQA